MRTIAVVITKILNPFVTSLAAVALVIFSQQIPTGQKILWFVLGVLVAAVPTTILYLGAKRGQVTSFWAPEGRERTKAFLAWVGVALVYVVLAYLAAAPKLVIALGLVLLVLGIVNLAVSSSFKLSVHSELVTLLTLIGILSISVNFIFLILLIILVGWSRIYLKSHTLSEVSFGVLASVLAVYLVFALLGLATF
jgi:membrane-associated phospholipid phosphatase